MRCIDPHGGARENSPREDSEALPRNGGKERKARYLDCAIINWWLDRIPEDGGPRYQTVRCGFSEGDPVYRGMVIQSHVQVAVRDLGNLIGVFRPTP